jgi:hypothetical protein
MEVQNITGVGSFQEKFQTENVVKPESAPPATSEQQTQTQPQSSETEGLQLDTYA